MTKTGIPTLGKFNPKPAAKKPKFEPACYLIVEDHLSWHGKIYNQGETPLLKPRDQIDHNRIALHLGKGWIRLASDEDKARAAQRPPAVVKIAQPGGTAAVAGETSVVVPAQVQSIPIARIRPDPTQPRKDFTEESMKELVDSIKQIGVEQAILVRPMSRWRQIVGFAARQWVKLQKKEDGYDISTAEMWASGIQVNVKEETSSDGWMGRLIAEGRVERKTVGGKSWCIPTAGALAPLTGDKTMPGEEEWLEIVYGERRWRGVGMAGLTEIPAKVRELTDTEAAELQAIENLDRDDLKPLEEGTQFQKLLSQPGYTVERVMQTTGKGRSTVYARLKLLTLPPEPLQMLATGKLPASTADLIAGCDPAIQERVSKAILHPEKYHLEDGEKILSVTRAKQAIAKIAAAWENEQRWQAAVAKAQKDGVNLLSDSELEKHAGYVAPMSSSPFVTLKQYCYDDPQGRSWSKLLGKASKGLTQYLGRVHDMTPQIWFKREDAMVAAKAAGVKFRANSSAASGGVNAAYKAQQAAERKKRKDQLAREDRGIGEIVDAIESMGANRLPADFWRFIAKTLAEDSCYDVARRANKRRQTGEKTRGDEALAKLAATMDATQAVGLLAEIVVYGVRGCYRVEKRLKPLGVVLGLEQFASSAGGQGEDSPNVRTDDEDDTDEDEEMEDAA